MLHACAVSCELSLRTQHSTFNLQYSIFNIQTSFKRGHPNPLRAHGAWIYLFAAIGAGAVVGADNGIEPPLLVGTGYVGVYRAMAAVSVGIEQRRQQFTSGVGLAVGSSLLATWLGADVRFLLPELLAIFPATATLLLEERVGYLARSTLVSGVSALVLAAPSVALAGGVSVQQAALLCGMLWFVFCWRTLRIAAPLRVNTAWDREQLRRQGLFEAALAAIWSIATAIVVRSV